MLSGIVRSSCDLLWQTDTGALHVHIFEFVFDV